MSDSEQPQSDSEVPPGFETQVTSNVESGSAVEEYRKQPVSVSSDDQCGKSNRTGRQRARPEFLDPSPPPTKRRGRGRPPGTGRHQKARSWFGNDPLESLVKKNGWSMGWKNPNMKAEPRYAAENLGQDVHGATTANDPEEAFSLSCLPSFGHDPFLHPAADNATTQVGSYVVSPSLASTLQAIINKHGDIAKDCPLESAFMRTFVLEGICMIVQELERKSFSELDISRLYTYHSVVKDAQTIKLDVKWLQQRLDDIQSAFKLYAEIKKLIDEKESRMKFIEYIKKDLQLQKIESERLHSEIEGKEGQLVLETQETGKLISKIKAMSAQFQEFQSTSLLAGII